MFDYLIIGGGSSGGVLANRLTESGIEHVCLLEAGPEANSPLISMPAGYVATIQDLSFNPYNWRLNTEPDSSMDGRSQYEPRGRGLGGSSNINAMVYIRGDAADFDHWAELGNTGWSFRDVLPYFKKAENNARGASEYHGDRGPLHVSNAIVDFAVYGGFLEAAQAMGHHLNPDFNGASQEGVGVYQNTTYKGQRAGVRRCYIEPARNRDNLTIKTGAQVNRILFEGKRAVGVEYTQDGKRHQLRVRKEVILSAGSFHSPHLLLLSGIGDQATLRRHGLPCVQDLPGVGKNLQEHPDVMLIYRSQNRDLLSLSPLGLAKSSKALLQYLISKKGLLSGPPSAVGAFLKTDPDEELPDFQLHLAPLAYRDHGRDLAMMVNWGFSLLVNLSRPKSRGEVTLASADPREPPKIQLNLLQHPDDLARLRQAVRLTQAIIHHPAMDAHRSGCLMPERRLHTDDEIDAYLRSEGAHAYHPVGSCKMGQDEMAVVDTSLRVHGVERLRVVDCSIMPTLIGGNTNATAIMIGERAAEMILTGRGPQAENVSEARKRKVSES